MNSPNISVLMPAYNAEKYIGEAIESILDQTFTDFELIIVDDCSTDETWNRIQEYATKDSRIVALRNETNLKISHSLNKGIAAAKGAYIARMDADDWAYPDRLAKQFALMEANPDVVISGGAIEICDEHLVVLNKRRYGLSDEDIRKKLFRYSPFCHPTVMYRTSAVRLVQGYDVNFPVAQDYDLYFRLGMEGAFANLTDLVLKLRTHKSSSSQASGKKQERNTIMIRRKAVVEYGYTMSFSDKLYNTAQKMSMYVVPYSVKFWLFNKLRSSGVL